KAKHLLKSRVDLCHFSVFIQENNGDGNVLKQLRKHCFIFLKSCLRLFAFRNVAEDYLDRRCPFEHKRKSRSLHINNFSIYTKKLLLNHFGRRDCSNLLKLPYNIITIVGMNVIKYMRVNQ